MTNKKYQSPTAFRRALEDRLKKESREKKIDLQRIRRSVSFDRLLCRLFAGNEKWILKGGYAMELRMQTARMTRDIDLSLPAGILKSSENPNMHLFKMLQSSADNDLGDYFTYMIGAPMLDLDAAPYGGARFPVTSMLAEKPFVKFHLDLGIGDAATRPFEKFIGPDWLGFACIAPGEYRGLSGEGQFAEKLHAYTRPREGRRNSRVKDLIDMILLIDLGLEPIRLRRELEKTFTRRNSHPLPRSLRAPPEFWHKPYEALARECDLSSDIATGFTQVSDFYDLLV